MKRLKALVTGASSGIGKELARELAKDGYDLVIVARREDRLKEIKQELESKYGISVHYVRKDLSSMEDVKSLAEEVRDVDLLVNDAGIGLFGGFLKSDAEREMKMMDLNMKALFYLTKTYGSRMAEKESGGIINVASLAGFKPYPNIAVYSATKAFVLSLTQAVSKELESKGVRVMALCPGSTSTEFFLESTASQRSSFFKAGGLMRPEIVAKKGLQAYKKGRKVYIPGLLNQFLNVLTSLMPNRFFVGMIYGLLKSE